MDLTALEVEAQEAALRQVAQMLQRPDQLEKLDQFKKRTARKKAALEAMLKTAVQSQLDGVRTGLVHLQSAADDIKKTSECMDEVCESLKAFAPLRNKLKMLKDESEKYSQCAAAMENLKTIYDIQVTIDKAYELIGEDKLLHAHKHLTELEAARDDVMFEVFKLQKQSEYDLNVLKAYFSELEKLSVELGKQLWYIMGRTLEAVRGTDPGPQRLVTALRIIEREERNDNFCIDRFKSSQFMPPGRPRRWREKCFDVLESLVQNRIEGNQLADRGVNKQWLALYLEVCRRIICEDLVVVRRGCLSCFPPDYNIYDRFVMMYHRKMSERLKDISQGDLEKHEIIQLLGWLRVYTGQDMLGHPSFHVDVHRLVADEPLLSTKTYMELVDKFREQTQVDLKEWLEKTLNKEKEDWYSQAKPEEDASLCYYTPLPSILYGMIEDQTKLAKEISPDIVPTVAIVCLDEMIEFTQRYKDAFHAFKLKHFEDRSRFLRSFTPTMIAVANNCLICGESTDRLNTYLRITVESDKIAPVLERDRVARSGSVDSNCDDGSVSIATPGGKGAPLRLSSVASQRQEMLQRLDLLNKKWMHDKEFAQNLILDEIFGDMMPHLADILTKKWSSGSPFQTICVTIEDYFEDHKHLKQLILKWLLETLQVRVLHEYFKAMEGRRLSFQSYDERKNGAEQLKSEADQFRRMFQRLLRTAKLDESTFEIVADVLACAAEILVLSDKSLLSLEVSSFVRKYPDISMEQLAGLVQMREDMGRSEARQLAQEILDQNRFRPKLQALIVRVFSGL